jgi:hypothetical protein
VQVAVKCWMAEDHAERQKAVMDPERDRRGRVEGK